MKIVCMMCMMCMIFLKVPHEGYIEKSWEKATQPYTPYTLLNQTLQIHQLSLIHQYSLPLAPIRKNNNHLFSYRT